MKGDKAAAHVAFTTARNEAAKLIADHPDYPEALCVHGMADAALGNKAGAIRKGRRAVELLPVSKNAIEGYLLIEYLALIYAWTGEGSRLRTVIRRSGAPRIFELWRAASAPALGSTTRRSALR
jgi:hypothetical protein